MNANTRLRLWKEARALLPMWAAVFCFMGATTRLDRMDGLLWSSLAYVFGCALLGASIVGQEFQHRTMGTLLAQPVPRLRVWHEKLAVLGLALLGLILWFTLLAYDQWHAGKPRFRSDADAFAAASTWLAPLVLGFCTSPTFALLTRSTIGGVTLTFLCPVLVFLGCGWLLPDEFSSPRRWVISATYYASVFGIYSGLMLLWGRRRFQRLEDDRSQPQELRLPTVQELRCKCAGALFVLGVRQSPIPPAADSLTLKHSACVQNSADVAPTGQSSQSRPRSGIEHLVRKEIRLQQPAFVVAFGLVVLWLVAVAVVFTRSTVDKHFLLLLPVILLGLGIPLLVGIVSTAEERSLGVHEWHLTLPVSARRLWTVKVLVALGVNALLGLLLPGLLAHASSWLANDPRLVQEIPGNANALLIANLVILGAALYASSASANTMRALIGAIVLFMVGAMVPPGSMQIGRWLGYLIRGEPPDGIDASWGWFEEYYWRAGWLCWLGWVWRFGLGNFRFSLDSVGRQIPRVTGLYVAACLYVSLPWHWWFIKALWLQYRGD